MQKTFSIAIASVLLATSAIGTGAMADSRDHSRFNRQDRVVQGYCSDHYDRSCNDWQRNRNNWDEAEYQGWYREHYRHRDFRADNAISGLFGFAAGVITGSVVNGSGMSHVSLCEDRYRSYDRRSDTFLGYDGMRHDCRL